MRRGARFTCTAPDTGALDHMCPHVFYSTKYSSSYKSPGLGQAKPEPGRTKWLWLGLTIFKAGALSGRAKAGASGPSRAGTALQAHTSLLDAREPENLALDALAPTQAIPAFPHGRCDRLAPLACAALMYNVVDSPVGVVPTRDGLSDEWHAAPGNGSKILGSEVHGPKGAYNARVTEGLPVGILYRLLSQPWEAE